MLKKYSHKRTVQPGVTLLIAILILSTILAVSFSLATILLAEARNSGDLLRTEPTLYAANAISEEAMFNVSRNTGITTYSSSVGALPVTSAQVFQNDAVQRVKILSTNTSFGCTTNCYVLYNPSDPYGPGHYARIKINFLDTNTPGALLHIYLCQWDQQNPPKNPDGTYKVVCSNPADSSYMTFQDTNPAPLSPGQSWDSSINCGGCMDLSGAKQQELILYQTTSGAPANVYAQISTFDSGGNPLGIPYFGQTAVGISSNNSGVARDLKIVVPNAPTPTINPPQTPWRNLANNNLSSDPTDYNMGYRFTPAKGGTITQLALRAPGTASHVLRLYDMGGNVLATTNITANNMNWVVANITAVPVLSGTSYVVAMRVGAGNSFYYQSAGTSLPKTSGDVTINDSRIIFGSDLMPNSPVTYDMYGQVDVTFVPN